MSLQLVFIHGWGFTARFWDGLAARLAHFPQVRIDLEFFGASQFPVSFASRKILIGHSLGLMHGLKLRQDWNGWIAINSFPRFMPDCVPAARLREMRMRLQRDVAATLRDFYQMIDAEPVVGMPDQGRLLEGLDELRDGDSGGMLAKLAVPGLVLAAGGDPLVPVGVSEELGRMAKKGGLLMQEEAGHLLPQTHAGWCACVISDFIAANFGEK